jgi:phosphatidylglycerophosphatase A
MGLIKGQPNWPRLLPTGFVVACATLGPIGRLKPGPGTWGSLAGLLYFTVFFAAPGLPGWAIALATLPALYLAVALCGEAEFRLGQRDPGGVVLDEFVVIPLVFLEWQRLPVVWVADGRWAIFLGGFALFRLFDIAKPLGIARLQNLPGGWGVVADDFAAALAACVSLHALGLAWTRWFA